MVRVFYSQKTEQILQKFELTHWRQLVQEKLEQKHQDFLDNWKNCAIGKRIRLETCDLNSIKVLFPEAIKLGYDFSVAMQEKNNEKVLGTITKMEQLPIIWRNED